MNNDLKQIINADLKQLKTVTGDSSLTWLFIKYKNVRIVTLFRILNYNYFHRKKTLLSRILHKPLSVYYQLMTNKYCIDLPLSTRIGPGLKLNHAYGIIINGDAVIGDNCYIGHNVTIGSNGPNNLPVIGDNVTIFTGSIIVGDLEIGNNSIVGAGSLVIKSIPPNSIVGGSTCSYLRKI